MKKLFLSLLTALFMFLPSVSVVMAAPSTEAVCEGIGLGSNGQGSGCVQTSGPTIDSTLRTVVSILSIIVGVVAVIMIIVAGIKFATSGGSADKITSAKNTILYALIGIAVAAIAQIIVKFVLNKAASP